MKRFTVVVAVALATMSMAGTALAKETVSPSPSASPSLRDRVRTEQQQRQDSRRAVVEEQKEQRETAKEVQKEKRTGFVQAIKDRFTEYRKQRASRWWDDAAKRLMKLVDREQVVADRIQERITKLGAAGRDVTALQANLDGAKVKVALARQAIADASANMATIMAGTDANANLQAARELHRSVLEKIKEAHAALVKVLATTRGLSVTPTPTN